MSRNSEREMMSLILELCRERLPKHYKLQDRVQEVQVLTPTRKGMMGSINLNVELQKVLNPPSDICQEKEYGGRIFRENDKVMQIRNNYSLEWRKASDLSHGQGVFNGDVGIIHSINKDENKLTVIYDGDKYVTYEFGQLDELEHAYAMTVHKSQGSEFPVVVMPMTWVAPMLASRNLLYTGVTRGKTVVVLVGSERQMMAMVDNNSIKKRNSGLALRIKNFL
jgi:exodeoxyribonuclease V alpha subunit